MIPLYSAYMPAGIIPEVEKNLYSGKLSYGENVKLFEENIGSFISNKYFLATSTYNHSLLVLISSIGLKPGDEIIASPISCLASNQPFASMRLKVNWVDVDPRTGSICIDDLKRKINTKTKAVFVNYFCGYINSVQEIYKIVKERDVLLIDDAIEAFGSLYSNNMAGNLLADATVFSFQTVRLPNTIDGGGISFNNFKLYEKARLIRDYGIDRSKFRDSNNEISNVLDIQLIGYGAMMSEINAIIGNRQIPVLDNLLTKQRENGMTWDKILRDINGISPLNFDSKAIPNYWVYGVIADKRIDSLMKFRKMGFYSSSVHINNNIYSVFNNKKELKGVNDFINTFFALPSGWWVDKNDILNLKW